MIKLILILFINLNVFSQSFDFNQKLDYNCVSWTIDPNKFVLPTEIEFKTMVEKTT